MPKTASSHQKKQSAPVQEESAGRPFWSGTISFGLVSIPVNLYPANRNSRVSLRMLGPDGQPLKRDYYSEESGKDLEESETVRGFQTGDGEYVTVTDEELERLAPEKSRDINLRLFAPINEISPIYFDRGYILTPADKSGKAYRLLAQTMEEAKRAGIATFVMRGKEYLVAILAINGILRAETLRFHDEVRTPADIGLPKKKKPNATLVRAFDKAIEYLSKKSLDRSELRDEYAAGMLKLIEQKHAKHKDIVETEKPAASEKPAKVVDLMEVLKASLSQGQKTRRGH